MLSEARDVRRLRGRVRFGIGVKSMSLPRSWIPVSLAVLGAIASWVIVRLGVSGEGNSTAGIGVVFGNLLVPLFACIGAGVGYAIGVLTLRIARKGQTDQPASKRGHAPIDESTDR